MTAPIRGRAFVTFLSFLLFCYTYHLFCFSTSMGYGFALVGWGGVGWGEINNVSLFFFPFWVWVGGVGWGVITSLCSSSAYGFGLGLVAAPFSTLLLRLNISSYLLRCCLVVTSLLFHLPATLKHVFISLLLGYNISSLSSSCYA